MTQNKHFKEIVRTRMEKTGERYAAARRHVADQRPSTPLPGVPQTLPLPGAPSHLPLPGVPTHLPLPGVPRAFRGSVPAAAVLRTILTAAGLHDPETGGPLSEAMAFGIGGGIGIGVFSFLYEDEDFASFFLGSRHLWWDDQAWFEGAFERIGGEVRVREMSGARVADEALREMVEDGPVVAFVEAGLLPHRKIDPALLGGGYHVVVVLEIDEEAGTALIADAAEQPITIPLELLAAARARIKKFRHRALSYAGAPENFDLGRAAREAIAACRRGLDGEGAVGARKNFSLDALAELSTRMAGGGRQSWTTVFTPGKRMWTALSMLFDGIETGGTGGGLSRPLFGAFLKEAGEVIGVPAAAEIGESYIALGRQWTALADAALPSEVPLFREAKELFRDRAKRRRGIIDAVAIADIDAAGARLDAIAEEMADCFPLTEAQAGELRKALAARVADLHATEDRVAGTLETVA